MYGVYRAIGALPAARLGLPDGAGAVAKIHALMERVYAPVLALARELGLPVIDLPRSFDCRDAGLYRMQIEPSAAGGALIAELVAHVLRAHDWGAARSVLYRKRRGDAAVHAEPNDGSRPWRISPFWEQVDTAKDGVCYAEDDDQEGCCKNQ